MTKPYFNEFGEELPDSTPIAKPVRFNRPGSTLDEIRRNLGLAQKLAEETGHESFEEADDFEVGDDFDPSHPFAHQVDNMNQEFERIRAEVRSMRDRGEIELRHDGSWVRRQPVQTPTPSPSSSMPNRTEGGTAATAAGGGSPPPGAGGSAPAAPAQQGGSGTPFQS